MKKCVMLLSVSLLLCGALFAESAKAPTATQSVTAQEKQLSPEALARKQRIMAKIGGFLDVPGTGPAIVVLDTCKVPDGVSKRFHMVFDTVFRQPFEMEAASLAKDKSPFAASLAERKGRKALAVISLVEASAEEPTLAVYPEDRVAIVNVSRLATDDQAELEARIIKETWRAIGFVLGVGYASNDADVMQPIGSTIELDALTWQVIQPMNYMRAQKVLQKYGVKRGHRTTYRRACQQGWAPAPTNDIQKAVWDAVKAEAATNKLAVKTVK